MNNRHNNSQSNEQNAPRRITYRDIAEALGVSKMTVSYSLRNDPRIPEATRIRVQEKAEEMGYRPDPMLSALTHYRHENHTSETRAVFAWINFCRRPEMQRKQKLFNLYWEGAQRKARQLGFRLEEFNWKDLPLHRMHSIFKSRGIRGILLTPTPTEEEPTLDELDTFPWKDYAIVRFGESLRSLNVNFISSAQVSNTILAFEQIIAKGYQRIGFVGFHLRHRLFSAGYLWAQQSQPLSQQLPPLFLQKSDSASQQQEALKVWIQTHSPDAIIVEGLDVLQPLMDLGYNIPSDFGLASVSRYDNPINAGIDQNPEEIGGTAILALASQINENSYGIPERQKEILIEGRWVDGSMLPPRK